jgi:hypothetical protein
MGGSRAAAIRSTFQNRLLPVSGTQAPDEAVSRYKIRNNFSALAELLLGSHTLSDKCPRISRFSRAFQRTHSLESSTTHQADDRLRRFRITHPFHPLYDKEFDVIDYVHDWREHRVYFYGCKEKLTSIPTSWTNFLPEDPFITASSGRSYFRVAELLQLVAVIKAGIASNKRVKEITP